MSDEIGNANGRKGQDRDCDGKLRRDSGLDRRMVFRQTRLRIRTFGSETTSLQIPSVSTWRISCKFFDVNPDRR